MQTIAYTPLEKIKIVRPVKRVPWISQQCSDKWILDLGCYDETALAKKDTEHWLHGSIARGARQVTGIDSSMGLPPEGIVTGPRSKIFRGNVMSLDKLPLSEVNIDLIVAGELIEHLPDTASFFRHLKELFPGRELIASTPNSTSMTNLILAAAGRESCHPDHLQIYSYKTLHKHCLLAGFTSWEIRPYYVSYPEMSLRASGVKRHLIKTVEKIINAGELVLPLLAGGLILHVTKI